MRWETRAEARTVQNFVGINVANARNNMLVEQRCFQASTLALQTLAKYLRRQFVFNRVDTKPC